MNPYEPPGRLDDAGPEFVSVRRPVTPKKLLWSAWVILVLSFLGISALCHVMLFFWMLFFW